MASSLGRNGVHAKQNKRMREAWLGLSEMLGFPKNKSNIIPQPTCPLLGPRPRHPCRTARSLPGLFPNRFRSLALARKAQKSRQHRQPSPWPLNQRTHPGLIPGSNGFYVLLRDAGKANGPCHCQHETSLLARSHSAWSIVSSCSDSESTRCKSQRNHPQTFPRQTGRRSGL